jgi:succinate dehydrogenase hydrophobic anchor subunit
MSLMSQTTRSLVRAPNTAFLMIRRKLATYGPLDADAGALATRVHHTITASLLVFTPILFVVPDSYTDGAVNKVFGTVLSGSITAHSWIGLNYVARDYVPKISYALLGPAKVVNAGMALITFLGMTKICVFSPGGLKGVVVALWNAEPKDDKEY